MLPFDLRNTVTTELQFGWNVLGSCPECCELAVSEVEV